MGETRRRREPLIVVIYTVNWTVRLIHRVLVSRETVQISNCQTLRTISSSPPLRFSTRRRRFIPLTLHSLLEINPLFRRNTRVLIRVIYTVRRASAQEKGGNFFRSEIEYLLRENSLSYNSVNFVPYIYVDNVATINVSSIYFPFSFCFVFVNQARLNENKVI